jgi:hypothetical protein
MAKLIEVHTMSGSSSPIPTLIDPERIEQIVTVPGNQTAKSTLFLASGRTILVTETYDELKKKLAQSA